MNVMDKQDFTRFEFEMGFGEMQYISLQGASQGALCKLLSGRLDWGTEVDFVNERNF